MAIFKDPINSLAFEIPAGWACDLLYSTMTDFFFARWDRPEEMLVVHLRRACVAEDQSDDQWVEKIREEVGGKAPLFDIDSPNGRVVGADFVSEQGMTQRVAFLRGAHVDIAVEQRNADMESSDTWKALTRAIKSAVSEANKPQTGDYGPTAFNKTIEEANRAFEKKDYAGVVEHLNDAIKIFGRTKSESLPFIFEKLWNSHFPDIFSQLQFFFQNIIQVLFELFDFPVKGCI